MSARLARISHYFFPQSSNNHKAIILQPSFLSVIVAIFLTSQFFLNYFNLFYPRVLGFSANISPEKLITLTNQERTRRGLSPLQNNSLLNEAAQRKAGDMFALNYWAHNSPTGRSPWIFFKEVGYRYVFAGENLARDFDDSEAVVRAWMDSPTHRDNILSGQYEEIGLAVVNGVLEGIETTLVVQLFGTPTPAPAAQIEAESEKTALLPIRIPIIGQAVATTGDRPATRGSSSLNLFSLTKILVIFLVGLLVGVFMLDLYLVSRRKVMRLSGRSLAHLTFLLFLLLAVLALQPGLVL